MAGGCAQKAGTIFRRLAGRSVFLKAKSWKLKGPNCTHASFGPKGLPGSRLKAQCCDSGRNHWNRNRLFPTSPFHGIISTCWGSPGSRTERNIRPFELDADHTDGRKQSDLALRGCEKMRNHFYSQPPFLYSS